MAASFAPRQQALIAVCFVSIGLILLAAFHLTDLSTVPAGVLTLVSAKLDKPATINDPTLADLPDEYDYPAGDPPSEKGNERPGEHFHVRLSRPSTREAAIPNCEYPILIHTSPDGHCSGAFVLYGSIVRNVLMQPEQLKGKTCVHFTYVDPKLDSFETMYQWKPRPNPFPEVPDCDRLNPDGSGVKTLSAIVPFRWQAIAASETPAIMNVGFAPWRVALDKVNSWAFDLYPRALYVDADSVFVRELANVFDEVPAHVTVAGAIDQVQCNQRDRLNGGFLLIRPSRYFHMAAVEALFDSTGSCMSGNWLWSDQELINCICGFNLHGKELRALRPEFVCQIMPIYNSLWNTQWHCSDANVVPIRSLHYTVTQKPWNLKEDQFTRFDQQFWRCLRDASRAENLVGLLACKVPNQEEIRAQGPWAGPGDHHF